MTVARMIPYGQQWVNEEDIQAVGDVLRSSRLTTGPSVAEFERRFAEVVGAKHAVAVSSGTAALHLAMAAAGIGPGDRTITSPNTFLASANCSAYVGAVPDFCDIDPVTYNMCPNSLQQLWRDDVRAVVAVDYAGQSSDMPTISKLAHSRGAVVIEDASHAVGGRFVHDGRAWKIGGHPWADATIFSFHPVKTITTGEGGMLVTDNEHYAAKARELRNHGMVRETSRLVGLGSGGHFTERGPWYYEMQQLGFNYRISDLQCALGISQLNRLSTFVTRRREIVQQYNDAFHKLDCVTTPGLRNDRDAAEISWHLYTLLVDFRSMGKTRTQVMEELRSRGVNTQVLYIPVYLQPWYVEAFGYRDGKCPVAERYYQRALSLPLFAAMDDRDVETVIQAVYSTAEANTPAFNEPSS